MEGSVSVIGYGLAAIGPGIGVALIFAAGGACGSLVPTHLHLAGNHQERGIAR